MLKSAITTLTLFAAFSAQAASTIQMTCIGVQDNKGGRGTLSVSQDKSQYSFTGTDGKSVAYQASGVFDSKYKPRTPNPREDRYTIQKQAGHAYDNAWMTKDIISSGQGYLEFEANCGPDGSTCDISYFCKEGK